jgi:hypothetical protein
MRTRDEIKSAAGPNLSLEQLKLEVLLDIREQNDKIIALLQAQQEEPETVDVQVTAAPKKTLSQKIKDDLKVK